MTMVAVVSPLLVHNPFLGHSWKLILADCPDPRPATVQGTGLLLVLTDPSRTGAERERLSAEIKLAELALTTIGLLSIWSRISAAHRLCRLVWKILHEGISYIEQGATFQPKLLINQAKYLARQLRKFGYDLRVTATSPVPE